MFMIHLIIPLIPFVSFVLFFYSLYFSHSFFFILLILLFSFILINPYSQSTFSVPDSGHKLWFDSEAQVDGVSWPGIGARPFGKINKNLVISVENVVQADKNGEISSHIQFQLIIEQEKRW